MIKQLILSIYFLGVMCTALATIGPTNYVRLQSDTGAVEIHFMRTAHKRPAVSNKTYTWYKAGQLQETLGGKADHLLHGDFQSFYANGQLKAKGKFKKGLKCGAWNTWNNEGELQQKQQYRFGRLAGKTISYDQGMKTAEQRFRAGVLHGKQATFINGEINAVSYFKKGEAVTADEFLYHRMKSKLFAPKPDDTNVGGQQGTQVEPQDK